MYKSTAFGSETNHFLYYEFRHKNVESQDMLCTQYYLEDHRDPKYT